jgi:hypothetical protein
MNHSIFTKKYTNTAKVATACFLILTICGSIFAQYKGAPVKKERLVQAIRSRQFQTRDIVSIINSNGVDFRLTPEIRKSLISAGARPEVIQAVSSNPRGSLKDDSVLAKNDNNRIRRNKSVPSNSSKPALSNYEDLLSRAIYSYKDQRNPKGAVSILQTATKARPQNPAAYQMLGFVYLYGLNNFSEAEKSMRESFMNGGSAVFRVFHDDNGKFTDRCTGSLFISKDTMRFESDDNTHTFETSAASIDKIRLDTESNRTWKKHSIFKVILKFGKEEAKFRFAPLTGAEAESKMVERFIAAANQNKIPTGSAMTASY